MGSVHDFRPYELPTEQVWPAPAREDAAASPATVLSPGHLATVEVWAEHERTAALPPTSVTLQRIEFLCQRESAVLSEVFLALFSTLLYRYTGRTDLTVLVADELGEGVRLVHADVSPEVSFRGLLRRVIAALHRAPRRPADAEPFPCQVVFGIGRGAVHDIARFPFDLCLQVQRCAWSPSGVVAGLHYNRAVFARATLERMSGHLAMLLASVAREPDRTVAGLPLLTDAERHELLAEWNGPGGGLPELCVHEVFEAQAARSPNDVAVVHEEQYRAGARLVQLTYGELNARANQLARCLQRLGVEAGDRVGVFLSPSAEMAVALLGILKAGAAYVPVDADDGNDSGDRLGWILAETGAAVVVTEAELLDRAGELPVEALCLDADRDALEDLPEEDMACRGSTASVAYVYPCGPRGKLRGVCGRHGAIVNVVNGLGDYRALGPGDGCALWCGMEEEALIAALWAPLLSGATLYVPPENVGRNKRAFAAWLAADHITSAWVPAELVGALLEHQAWEGNLSLRRLVMSERRVTGAALSALRASVPGLCVLNSYGPIEVAGCAAVYAVPEQPRAVGGERPAPIGRPLRNMRAYVLDAQQQLLPAGVAGELYLGGAGVGPGYLNQPGLTAERFVPDPFLDDPAARLYRTGDRVRYAPDGTLEFVGRVGEAVELDDFRDEKKAQETGVVSGGADKPASA